jgi:uncharacterized protein YjbI with pentapeptide repeats
LQGSAFAEADLTGASLSQAHLNGAEFRQAIARNADLSEAHLESALLWHAQLSNANLARAKLRGAWLEGDDLGRANLTDADLRNADLSGANLRGATFGLAKLAFASFSGAHLEGANLSGYLSPVDRGSSFVRVSVDARGASFHGAHIQAANFEFVTLTGADFADALAQGVSFSDANLEATNFSNAYLYGASLERAGLNLSFMRNTHFGYTKTSGCGEAEVIGPQFDLATSLQMNNGTHLTMREFARELSDYVTTDRGQYAEELNARMTGLDKIAEVWQSCAENATSMDRYLPSLAKYLIEFACGSREGGISVSHRVYLNWYDLWASGERLGRIFNHDISTGLLSLSKLCPNKESPDDSLEKILNDAARTSIQ